MASASSLRGNCPQALPKQDHMSSTIPFGPPTPLSLSTLPLGTPLHENSSIGPLVGVGRACCGLSSRSSSCDVSTVATPCRSSVPPNAFGVGIVCPMATSLRHIESCCRTGSGLFGCVYVAAFLYCTRFPLVMTRQHLFVYHMTLFFSSSMQSTFLALCISLCPCYDPPSFSSVLCAPLLLSSLTYR